jgi:hypothetical protein
LPTDAAIGVEADGRYNWCFRCVESNDVDGAENGFETPIEALCNLTSYLIQGADELMDIAYNNLEKEEPDEY